MDFVEEYARLWTKSEGEELETLSELIKSIRKLLKPCIHHLSGKMHTIYLSVSKKPEVVNELRPRMITLCWFQQIKQVTSLSSVVKITIMDAF
jgi:hypothetical protein